MYHRYIQAILARDLDALEQTITRSDTLHFIDTSGRITKTRQAYLDFHATWFENTNWTIAFELDELVQKDDFGYAMTLFTCQESRENDKKMTLVSYATLIFHLEDGAFHLIADACTPIRRTVE